MFLDPDDRFSSNTALESLLSVIECEHVDVVGGNINLFNQRGEFSEIDRQRLFDREGIASFELLQDISGFQRFMFRTSFLRENQIEFPAFRRFEDPLFLYRALETAGVFGVIKPAVYDYTVNKKHYSKWAFQNVYDHYSAGIELLERSSEQNYSMVHQAAAKVFLNKDVLMSCFQLQDNESLLALLDAGLAHIRELNDVDREAQESFARDYGSLRERASSPLGLDYALSKLAATLFLKRWIVSMAGKIGISAIGSCRLARGNSFGNYDSQFVIKKFNNSIQR